MKNISPLCSALLFSIIFTQVCRGEPLREPSYEGRIQGVNQSLDEFGDSLVNNVPRLVQFQERAPLRSGVGNMLATKRFCGCVTFLWLLNLYLNFFERQTFGSDVPIKIDNFM